MAPADFIEKVVAVFRSHKEEISTEQLTKGLTSDQVLEVLHEELSKIGFDLESGKKNHQKKIIRKSIVPCSMERMASQKSAMR